MDNKKYHHQQYKSNNLLEINPRGMSLILTIWSRDHNQEFLDEKKDEGVETMDIGDKARTIHFHVPISSPDMFLGYE